MESANTRVSRASAGDLAYFLQDKGLCEEFVRWVDEKPPLQRLLDAKAEAREVFGLLEEGKKRKIAPRVVAGVLDAMATVEGAKKKTP